MPETNWTLSVGLIWPRPAGAPQSSQRIRCGFSPDRNSSAAHALRSPFLSLFVPPSPPSFHQRRTTTEFEIQKRRTTLERFRGLLSSGASPRKSFREDRFHCRRSVATVSFTLRLYKSVNCFGTNLPIHTRTSSTE